MTERVPLILDTDIGDNVDDAFALALTCRSPEIELLAVSTVLGDTERRAELALEVLRAFGREGVPVVPGSRSPRSGGSPGTGPAFDFPELSRLGGQIIRKPAAEFLVQRIESVPGPVTLCAIGPLTNVAQLIELGRVPAGKLRLVVMGGMIHGDRQETNISADPEAAATVLSSGLPITLVSLDVTLACQLTAEDVARIRSANHSSLQFLAVMMNEWMDRTGRLPILHDPLALAVASRLVRPRLEPMAVEVEAGSSAWRGRTTGRPLLGSSVLVCSDVDGRAFIELCLGRLLGLGG